MSDDRERWSAYGENIPSKLQQGDDSAGQPAIKPAEAKPVPRSSRREAATAPAEAPY
jgi:hypothetical protein